MNSEASHLRIPETDKSLIEAELVRLLAEKKFAGAPQMSAFLRYIVSQTLQGNADRIKAYSVGVDALGKPDSFDAQNDPSVRVLALRLRKTLSSIYESDAPAHAVVALRVGTYVPDFYKSSSASHDVAPENGPGCRQSPGVSPVAEPPVVMSQNAVGQRDDEFMHVAGGDTQGQAASSAHSATEFGKGNSAVKSKNPIVSSTGKSLGAGKVLMAGVLVITAGLWQFGNISTVGAKPSNDTVLALVASTVETDVSVQSPVEPQADSLPTLHYHSHAEQRDTVSLMGLLLSSRLVQAGSIRVINSPGTSPSDTNAVGSYQLTVGEFMIEGQTRLEAQIVNMHTGEVLDSSTLNFEQNNGEFSREEVASVELLAVNISSRDGPLYQDYCRYLHVLHGASCDLAR